jgi:L-serine/L-threonine ammonia-lyase
MATLPTLHVSSPLIRSESLSKLTGVEVYLKLDTLQPSGSFKIRGIGHHVIQAVNQRGSTSLISSSGGNAGMAVAYAGQRLGLPTTIVIPTSTPSFMIKRLEALSAKVLQYGAVWDEAHGEAKRIAEGTPDSLLVHPFDHPEIWEGHKTIVEELIQQLPSEPSAIMCSVGGGGLIAGIHKGLQESVWNGTSVVAIETEGAESFGQCIKQQKWVKLDKIDTIAKTLGALQVSEEAFKMTQKCTHSLSAHTVTDTETVDAIIQFLDEHRILIEPACAATLAALYSDRTRSTVLSSLDRTKPLVVFVCGGSIITLELLETFKAQFSSIKTPSIN